MGYARAYGKTDILANKNSILYRTISSIMQRRELLVISGLAVAGPGCADLDAVGRNDTNSDSTNNTKSTPQNTHATTQNDDGLKMRDHLFLRNKTANGEDQQTCLRITRESDKELLICGEYNVPGSWPTLVFSSIAEPGEVYKINVRLGEGGWRTYDWHVLECSGSHTPTKEGGEQTRGDINTDLAIDVRNESVEFIRNECDAHNFTINGAPEDAEGYKMGDCPEETA